MNREDPKSSIIAQGKRVRSLRNLTRLSRRLFTEQYGVPASTLQNWEDGKVNGVSEKGARRLVTVLKASGIHATFEWIMHGIGPGPTITEQLFLDAPATTRSIETLSRDEQTYLITQELLLFRGNHKNAIDIVVEDDGMEPRFSKGEYIAGCKRYQKNIANVVSLDCIVQTAAGEILLRRVKKGEIEDRYTLTCNNPQTTLTKPTLYDVELLSAAPVIWQRRKDP